MENDEGPALGRFNTPIIWQHIDIKDLKCERERMPRPISPPAGSAGAHARDGFEDDEDTTEQYS